MSYSTNPVCSPARSSILTGRASCETGVYKNGKPIRSDIPNLGQWFSQHTNYETIYAGKWHMPRSYTHFIPGFKVINTGLGGAGYVCDPVVSRACQAYIQNRPASEPFMMIASFMQPHDICEWLRLNTDCPGKRKYPEVFEELPELPANFVFDSKEPEKIKKTRQSNEAIKGRWTPEHWRYYKWSYYRHIEMVDGEIGRLLQVLEDTGRLKDTLIVFTSDHGEGLGHHQLVRKSVLYDEAVRVPLIFSWPGRIKNKINSMELVSGLDILPTLCDYAGIKIPTGVKGKSLRKVLEGEGSLKREYIVAEVRSNTGRMVRSKQYKYIKYLDDPVEQLFDMKNDSQETKNLAGEKKYVPILKKHKQMLCEWEKALDVASNIPEANSWITI
jgi:arylsulfatase A-like enzyme